jgi:hypothetical protein
MRPVTLWHRTGWAWICPLCAASETDFGMEHHARTIADEHVRTHTPEMTSSAWTTPPTPPADRDPVVARMVLASNEREVNA